MSRFFKSAAFPILIVVVLAFFAQRLISPSDEPKTPDYPGVPRAGRAGQVKSVKLQAEEQHRRGHPQGRHEVRAVGFADDFGEEMTRARSSPPRRRATSQEFNVEGRKSNGWLSLLTYVLPFVIFIAFWIFLMNQVQGGGSKVMSFGKSRAKRMSVDSPKITFRDVAGADEAVEELHEIKEFLENPKKFQALGARIPEGRAALRPAGHRQDAARARRRGRGRRAVLLDLRLGLRRDVRRRRRLPRARPLRAGQAELALHHLHGRDRRRRAPPRRRHGRRSRRARADAQPAARRDGRLRDEGQHHPHRRHEPAGHPRSRPPAPGPLRPPDRRRPPRPQGPREDPGGPHAWKATGQGHPRRRPRRPDAGLHRRRPRQPRQRGRAARRAQRQEGDRADRARRGDHARRRRPGEEDPGHGREGAPDHRLPRDGPRARRALPRALRPGPQDLRRRPRPGARLHDLHAVGGQVPHHARGAARTRWR